MQEHFESWEPGVRLADRWTDIFRQDFPVHFGIMASIATACFTGFLKDRIGGFLPYALSDGFFIFAFMWWLATRAFRRDALLVTPRGPMQVTLLLVTLLPAMYLAVPGTPLLIEAAGLRAWSLFPLACIMALTITRNAAQVRVYVAVILALCVITAVYGILQYRGGPGGPLAGGALALERHQNTVYYFVQGGASQFRAYSTFTFPAPFAGLMVYGMVLATGSALNRHLSTARRAFYAAIVPLLFVAMTVSGTRAALVMLVLGLMVVGYLRGLTFTQLLLGLPLLGALHIATLLTSGRAVARFSTIFHQEGALWGYVLGPVITAGHVLMDHPFGIGLGRTGTGVPFAITSRMPAGYFVFSDGDIGRAAVDMGVLGLIVLAFIVFALMPLTLKAARMLVATEEEGVGLGTGALVLSGGVIILIGSPLSSAPHGIIWWFFLGALVRLAMLRSQADAEEAEEAEHGLRLVKEDEEEEEEEPELAD
jgi:hypothetical protein